MTVTPEQIEQAIPRHTNVVDERTSSENARDTRDVVLLIAQMLREHERRIAALE